MSWTSEFEPPPPRPPLDPEEPDTAGFEVVDHPGDHVADDPQDDTDRDDDEDVSSSPVGLDIPDEGPLDPSIFDGLFDDLSADPPADGAIDPAAPALVDADLVLADLEAVVDELEPSADTESILDIDELDADEPPIDDLIDLDDGVDPLNDDPGQVLLDEDPVNEDLDADHRLAADSGDEHEDAPYDDLDAHDDLDDGSSHDLDEDLDHDDDNEHDLHLDDEHDHDLDEDLDHDLHLGDDLDHDDDNEHDLRLDDEHDLGHDLHLDDDLDHDDLDAGSVDLHVDAESDEWIEAPVDTDGPAAETEVAQPQLLEPIDYHEPGEIDPGDRPIDTLTGGFDPEATLFDFIPDDDSRFVDEDARYEAANRNYFTGTSHPSDHDADYQSDDHDDEHRDDDGRIWFRDDPAPILEPRDEPSSATAVDALLNEPVLDRAPAAAAVPAGSTAADYVDFDDDQRGFGRHRTPPSSRARPARRWPAFLVAVLIGALCGVGGALVLAQVISRNDTDAAAGTETPAADQPVVQVADGANPAGPGTASESGQTSLIVDGGIVLNSIGFVAGTNNLTEDSRAALAAMAETITSDGGEPAPLAITVRTFTGGSWAENEMLSQSQGEAVANHLAGLGVEVSETTIIPRASTFLSPEAPVPNFVVVTTGLTADGPVVAAVAGLSRYSIGIDPQTLTLRPESMTALDRLGAVMQQDEETDVGLAAYSHGQPMLGQDLAQQAATAVEEYLADRFGIDRARFTTITPGAALYALGPGANNHVTVAWGADAEIAAQLAASEQALSGQGNPIELAEDGTVTLGAAERDTLDGLVGLATGQRHLVINVIAASAADDATNQDLSERRAQAFRDHLADTDLPDGWIRVTASGNRYRLETGDQVQITAIHPMRQS